MLNLVNETNVEKSYRIFLQNFDEEELIQYKCPKTFIALKDNYLQFKEFIHSKRYVGFVDVEHDQLILIENTKKGNSSLTYLIYRYICTNLNNFEQANELIKRMFNNKGIEKIKIVCDKREIAKSLHIFEENGYFLDLSYSVGKNERLHYSKIINENN